MHLNPNLPRQAHWVWYPLYNITTGHLYYISVATSSLYQPPPSAPPSPTWSGMWQALNRSCSVSLRNSPIQRQPCLSLELAQLERVWGTPARVKTPHHAYSLTPVHRDAPVVEHSQVGDEGRAIRSPSLLTPAPVTCTESEQPNVTTTAKRRMF